MSPLCSRSEVVKYIPQEERQLRRYIQGVAANLKGPG